LPEFLVDGFEHLHGPVKLGVFHAGPGQVIEIMELRLILRQTETATESAEKNGIQAFVALPGEVAYPSGRLPVECL
jgi:hypothetical protein